MTNFKLIPSDIRYASAPNVDQKISIEVNSTSNEIVEYVRTRTIDLIQVYNDERQSCTIFRPTIKLDYVYNNTYSGSTEYLPFQYNLYYLDAVNSKLTGVWKGLPQHYEFDIFRPNIDDGHVEYRSKSAYTYNWTYSITYPFDNDYGKQLYTNVDGINLNWVASDGIPFVISSASVNGNRLITFKCASEHGLTSGEFVELSINYNGSNVFEVYSLGDGDSNNQSKVFNLYNVGYTGNTFNNGVNGTFKRILDPNNINETRSKYYVKRHKVIVDLNKIVVNKSGFELNSFSNEKKFEYSSITPNNISRISTLTTSNSYLFSLNQDIDLSDLVDNQKRPITEIFLTITNKGYSGYFNSPNGDSGLKQGWQFNISSENNSWWDLYNNKSNTHIRVNSYTKTNGVTKTFYYNNDLLINDIIDGDFCEWNDYEQIERVVSKYYHKLKYNEDIFQTTYSASTNAPGFYYNPHVPITLRIFSNYIEVGDSDKVTNVPNYSYFSSTDKQFRWRDIYEYGFRDNDSRGVDYPYLNSAHYPFVSTIFKLMPEGSNINNNDTENNLGTKPLIDDCE